MRVPTCNRAHSQGNSLSPRCQNETDAKSIKRIVRRFKNAEAFDAFVHISSQSSQKIFFETKYLALKKKSYDRNENHEKHFVAPFIAWHFFDAS
jgi:hypothetical protein